MGRETSIVPRYSDHFDRFSASDDEGNDDDDDLLDMDVDGNAGVFGGGIGVDVLSGCVVGSWGGCTMRMCECIIYI